MYEGVHISRVRSIELDDWSDLQLSVMHEIGNEEGEHDSFISFNQRIVANSVWEARAERLEKPTAHSARYHFASPQNLNEFSEEKQTWIQNKYKAKVFLKSPDCEPGEVSL